MQKNSRTIAFNLVQKISSKRNSVKSWIEDEVRDAANRIGHIRTLLAPSDVTKGTAFLGLYTRFKMKL